MDPYSQHNKQLEFYKYYETQRENYCDLTVHQDENNKTIKKLAKILFGKYKNSLDQKLTRLLFDDGMEIADLFCMLIELLVYGFDILAKKNIMDIEECTDDIIYTIKYYFISAGFDLYVSEDFIMNTDDITLYRDRNDYYCEILAKPPQYLCLKGWYVLNNRLIDNKQFRINMTTPLEHFKAFFISKQKRIFTIKFKFTC